MSGNVDYSSENDKNYGHGIICKNCVVRKYSEGGSAVRTVHPGTFVQVHSIRQDNVLFCIVNDSMQVDGDQLICKRADILFVPENLWGPLFTIEQWSRLSIIEDTKLAEAIGNITVGDKVQVLGPDFLEICIGNVAFRNSIAKLGCGVFFGIKITSAREQIESVIRKVSLLEPGTKGFPRGCDIVVTVDKIRPINVNSNREKSILQYDKGTSKQSSKVHSSSENVNNASYKTMLVLHLKEKSNTTKKTQCINNSTNECNINFIASKKTTIPDIPLIIGDEVVYIDSDKPEKGVVKWIGMIKNSLKVGVEFENPIGSGTGTVDNIELFKARYQHAMIMPPDGLIKLSDFMANNTKEHNNQYKVNNNNNYYNLRSSEICCERKYSNEEKLKLLKSNSHQCLKHADRTFPDDSFQSKISDDDIQKSKYKIYKSEHILADSLLHHNSRSFDSTKPTEKKLSNRRQCNSMDNDLLLNKESKLLINIQNSNNSIQKTPSQDLYDLMGHNWMKHEEMNNCKESRVGSLEENNIEIYQNNYEHENVSGKDNQNKDNWEYSEHSSSDESPNYYDTPKPISESYVTGELGKGSVVELMYKGEPHYGVIRWIGVFPEDRDTRPPRLIAGIEMEEERTGFTDGTFNSKRYFNCNPKKALFIPLHKCRKDSRFTEENQKQNVAKLNLFGQIDCPVVEGIIPPINQKGDLESICGKNRGIQGHHNSCYLDATLFAMFAFTSVFDSLLYRPPTKHDIPQYNEVQRVLRDEIVNPLRKNLYVRADRVMKLRTLLEKLSSVSGLTCEEKDPEEFLNSLLAQILKAEPFLKLSSGQEAFHYQLFVEKDERLTFPSVQQLFEQSFVTSDIKLKQVPSCLIIQMPRFGKSFKMYSRILPPQLLDVTDIIENSPRQCTVCGKLAEYECKDCFGQNGIGNGLESISFCKTCLDTAHNHHCRARHNYRSLTVPVEFSELQEHCIIPRLYMELFAVVCIETSHYVAFVKCGSGSEAPWCFFDSMADRKGEQNGYNIPEMVPCPDLPYWLSEDGAKTLNEMRDERQLPEHAKRLLCDAYMCMYQSPDMMMYR